MECMYVGLVMNRVACLPFWENGYHTLSKPQTIILPLHMIHHRQSCPLLEWRTLLPTKCPLDQKENLVPTGRYIHIIHTHIIASKIPTAEQQ